MSPVFVIFSFALGAAIGSFVNVIALRHHTGRTLGGRSKCAVCDSVIAWYDLVPVASFLVLGGRCRACQSRFSLRYPAVECALGVIFVLTAARFDFAVEHFLPMLYYWGVWSVGAAIVLYDIQHKIIPDRFVIIFGGLALLEPLSTALGGAPIVALQELAAGVVLALPFFLIWLLSRGRWMGLGDAKLALVIGWLLGLASGVAAIILAFWIGAGVSLIVLFGIRLVAHVRGLPHTAALTMKSEIPFAPFILLGAFLAFWLELNPLALVYFVGY